MGLLKQEERYTLSDLLSKLPNIDYPSVRNQLMSGIPQDLKAQIISIGASKPDLMSIVIAVDDDIWNNPDQGSWPVLQLIQNAIYSAGKTSPLHPKLQALYDILKKRTQRGEGGSATPSSKDDSKRVDMPIKDAEGDETQESNEPSPTPSLMDVGIVIALREEFIEFHNEIKTRSKALRDEATGRYYYQFEHASADSNHRYRCIATFVGEMGAVKASLTTQRLISQWEPLTLVMIGIAAALSKDVRIGDVVIATQVDAYLENAKAVPGTDGEGYEFMLSGEVYRSTSDLLNTIRNFEFVHGELFQNWRMHSTQELQQLLSKESLEQLIASKRLRDQVQMVDGHLASGPTVGAAPAFKDWLKRRDRKYLALEMEAGGLMAAVYEQADPKRTLVLRAISDDGDERKEEMDKMGEGVFRRFAMNNAIQLLWRFFDAGILPHH